MVRLMPGEQEPKIQDLRAFQAIRQERDVFLAGMIALLGAPDYRTEYECQHGTPLGCRCRKDCHLNVVRAALKHLPRL
jgi:hypothetical protein